MTWIPRQPSVRTPRSASRRAGDAPVPLSVVVAASLAVAAGACRDGGPATGPDGTRPSRLAAVSPESAAVEAGSEGGDRLEVRVSGPDGAPLEGVEVRFLLAGGPGRVAPATASTAPDGTAAALYAPGSGNGEARIRADVPSAPWLAPVSFRRSVRPGRRLRLSAASGDGQRAEAGSRLPVPLAVSAREPGGEAASGVRVAFQVTDAPGTAVLSSDTTLTGGEGGASTLLTLSGEPGPHRVRAVVAGPAAGDTVRFRAEAVGSLSSGIRVDSVRPERLAEGEPAILYGRGLDAADEIWLDGASTSASGGSVDRIRVRLPEGDRCLPRRRSSLRVRAADGSWSNEAVVEVAPAEPAPTLAVGEARTLAAPGPGECLRLPPASGRAYRLALVSTARSPAGRTPLALRVRTGVGGLGERSENLSAPGRASTGEPRTGPDRGERPGRPARERRLRLAAREELRVRRARPVRRAAGDPSAGSVLGGAATSNAARTAAAGDTLRLHFAVGTDLSVSCTDTADAVTGVVRAAGPGVAVVQDTAAPGGLTGEDLRLVRDEFEELVLPTDTAYFGPPADIDGNGRVILLLTPRVNDLTPRGSESRVGGFFLPLDLADAGPGGGGVSGGAGVTCPASNEGELLYLSSADPEGRFGPPLDRDGALRNARSIGSHELEHLLSAEQRIVLGDGGFDDLEAVWLAEGMAHLAEEVVGHAAAGTRTGSNLGFDAFGGSRERLESFNTFHLQNFGRLQLFLSAPSRTPALAPVDPGGAASLRMRGFAWLLSRWMADRAGPSDEAAFVRGLSVGGARHLRGIENVERAAGREWGELLLDFVRVPLLDDRESPSGPDAAFGGPGQLATWNLRALYRGLAENPSARRLFPLGYPLSPPRLGSDPGPLTLDLPAGAPAYFAVGGSAPSPALSLRIASTDGTPPPASAGLHLTLIRVR